MKVAVVCPYAADRPGGVQNQAIRLVGWLNEAGHDARLIVPGVLGGPPGTIYLGTTISVRANRSVAPVSIDPRVVRRTVEAVAGADVVHIHEPLVPMVALAALTGRTPPKVGTFHADPGLGVRTLYRMGGPVLRRWLSRLAVATAVSKVAAAGPARLLPAKPVIVPNAIDVESFDVGADRRPRRVAFLGRDEPRKGLDVLLQAWTEIEERVPGAELVVMGAERPPLPGVTFTGPVGEDQKRRMLGECGVLVAPNLGGESFGLVLTEGMAAGCAVVASDLPAFRAVLGDAGLLVPPGDPGKLAAALEQIVGNNPLRDELAGRSRERVRRFDRATVLDEYVEAYERALV